MVILAVEINLKRLLLNVLGVKGAHSSLICARSNQFKQIKTIKLGYFLLKIKAPR